MIIKTDDYGIDGIVNGDPLRELPIGATIRFSHELFPCQVPTGINRLMNWDLFKGALISLHFGDLSRQRIIGSGVLVAPGVAIAARHVAEAEMAAVLAGGGFICSAITSYKLLFWRPRHVVSVPNSDLAFLTLEYASELPDMFRQAVVTTRLPRIGERIVIAGIRHENAGEGSDAKDIGVNVMVAAGTVTARYANGRDRVLLPGPVVEIDCPAMGGMSGGPAFDGRGYLIGVLSSSMDGEGQRGPAYVSLLWPMLGMRLTPPWPGGVYKTPISLIEMDRRLCAIDRPEAVQVSHDPAGNYLTTYTAWE